MEGPKASAVTAQKGEKCLRTGERSEETLGEDTMSTKDVAAAMEDPVLTESGMAEANATKKRRCNDDEKS